MCDLIETIDMPMAPPRFLRSGAPVGLELLDLILHPLHVQRITEHLVLTGTTYVARSLVIDVSMSRLTGSQLHSARLYSASRSTPEAMRSTDMPGYAAADAPAAGNRQRPGPSQLWLPVLRVSRQESAPVDVTDGNGRLLPKASQSEIHPLLTAALTHLFSREADRLGEKRAKLLDDVIRVVRREDENARWLIQSALKVFIRNGLGVMKHDLTGQPPDDWPESRRRARDAFLEILDGGVFGPLLELVVTSQFVVVGLDDDEPDQVLKLETPRLAIDGGVVTRRRLYATAPRFCFFVRRALRSRVEGADLRTVFGKPPGLRTDRLAEHSRTFARLLDRSRQVGGALSKAAGRRRPLARCLRGWRQLVLRRERAAANWRRLKFELKSYQTITVRYRTALPPTSSSYHLRLSTEENLTIEKALLLSDEDVPLLEDMQYRVGREIVTLNESNLAQFGGAEEITALARISLLDTERSITRLLDLLETRLRQLRLLWNSADDKPGGAPAGERSTNAPDEQAFALSGIHDEAAALRQEVWDICESARRSAAVGRREGMRLVVAAESVLSRLATLLQACQDADLGYSLTSDDDPEESEAHVHRRARRESAREAFLRQDSATVLIAIRENTPALRGRVLVAVGSLAAIVLVMGWFIFEHQLWLFWGNERQVNGVFGLQADALITVLLLVPGVLITRLDVARGSSLLAAIRALPRFAAYGSLIATTLLAVAIASGVKSYGLRNVFAGCFAMILVFFLVQALDIRASLWAVERGLTLDLPVAPRWLLRPNVRRRPVRELDLDVRADGVAVPRDDHSGPTDRADHDAPQ